MGILHGVIQQTSGNQTSRMSHVNHQQSAHLVGNLAHALVVPLAAVSRATTDNQLGLVFDSQTLHLIVVYTTSLLVQVVTNGLVQDTRSVYQ